MVVRKTDEKEAEEVKKFFIHYLDKKSDTMKNTEFKAEDIFGGILNKNSFSPEQITNFSNFLGRMMGLLSSVCI